MVISYHELMIFFVFLCNKMLVYCINCMKGDKTMLFLYLTPTAEKMNIDDSKLEFALYQVASGNSDALSDIYDIAHKSVYAYALSILKNTHDAEDVLQDCFISIWNGAKDYKTQRKPMAWIMTITRNLCYMKLRGQKRSSFMNIDDIINSLDEVAEATVEDKLILKECLSSLSPEEREIVTLHAVAGFKHREIADMLDMALPTVLSKYSRAIKKLKKFLTQGETENEKK